eukprot:TRINITY_DN23507_c0_g1_i1.p1 TRINITY_DN23507_c0_g1~~TRINITY_DN23507_c0_g1_i1.p1  ORF type:complete len:1113 (+),score=198.80 TRINITY_DN23507_c0_g1_i1:82-3339(+)
MQRSVSPAGSGLGSSPPSPGASPRADGATACVTKGCGNLGNPGSYCGLCLQCWLGSDPLAQLPPVEMHPTQLDSAQKLPQLLLQASGEARPGAPAVDAEDWRRHSNAAVRLEESRRRSSGGALSVSTERLDPGLTPSLDHWPCRKCTFSNALSAVECQMCNHPRHWNCPDCCFENPGGRKGCPHSACLSCGSLREWTCSRCTFTNRLPASVCGACEWRVAPGQPHPLPPPPNEAAGKTFFLDSQVLGMLSASQCHSLVQQNREEYERNQGIQRGRPRLEDRLRRLGCSEQVMPDDGNCLFRALSFQLWRSQRWHAQLRRAVVAHMRGHRDGFIAFFTDGAEFDGYLQRMGRLGTWGDEHCLRAAADLLCVCTHVVQSTEGKWYLVYAPEQPTNNHVFLTYLAPVHYNGLALTADSASARYLRLDQATSLLAELRLLYDEVCLYRSQAGESAAQQAAQGLAKLAEQLPDLEKEVSGLDSCDRGVLESGLQELSRLVNRRDGGSNGRGQRPASPVGARRGAGRGSTNDAPPPVAPPASNGPLSGRAPPTALPGRKSPPPSGLTAHAAGAAEPQAAAAAPAAAARLDAALPAAAPPPAAGQAAAPTGVAAPAAEAPAAAPVLPKTAAPSVPPPVTTPPAPAAAPPPPAVPHRGAASECAARPAEPIASPRATSAQTAPPTAPSSLRRYRWLRLVPLASRAGSAGTAPCELAGLQVFEAAGPAAAGARPPLGKPLPVKAAKNPGGQCNKEEGPANVLSADKKAWKDWNHRALVLELQAPAAPAALKLRHGGVPGRDVVAWRLEGSTEGSEGPWQLLHECPRPPGPDSRAQHPPRWEWQQHWLGAAAAPQRAPDALELVRKASGSTLGDRDAVAAAQRAGRWDCSEVRAASNPAATPPAAPAPPPAAPAPAPPPAAPAPAPPPAAPDPAAGRTLARTGSVNASSRPGAAAARGAAGYGGGTAARRSKSATVGSHKTPADNVRLCIRGGAAARSPQRGGGRASLQPEQGGRAKPGAASNARAGPSSPAATHTSRSSPSSGLASSGRVPAPQRPSGAGAAARSRTVQPSSASGSSSQRKAVTKPRPPAASPR